MNQIKMNFEELEDSKKPKQDVADIAHLINAMNEATFSECEEHFPWENCFRDLTNLLHGVDIPESHLQRVIDCVGAEPPQYDNFAEKFSTFLSYLMTRIDSKDIVVDFTAFGKLMYGGSEPIDTGKLPYFGIMLEDKRVKILGELGHYLGYMSKDCEFCFDTAGTHTGQFAERSVFRGKEFGWDIGRQSKQCEFYSETAISENISVDQDGSSRYFCNGEKVKNPGTSIPEIYFDEYEIDLNDFEPDEDEDDY